jgi:hypothetical protein
MRRLPVTHGILLLGSILALARCHSDADIGSPVTGTAGTTATSLSGSAGAAPDGAQTPDGGKTADGGAMSDGGMTSDGGAISDISAMASSAGADGGSGGEAPVQGSYPCTAGGSAGAPMSSDTLQCVSGQTFCYVKGGLVVKEDGGVTTTPLMYFPSCRSFASDGPEQCAKHPTCGCFCSTFDCVFQCSCSELKGIATVTCGPV